MLKLMQDFISCYCQIAYSLFVMRNYVSIPDLFVSSPFQYV